MRKVGGVGVMKGKEHPVEYGRKFLYMFITTDKPRTRRRGR
jgi:hypothetical protein